MFSASIAGLFREQKRAVGLPELDDKSLINRQEPLGSGAERMTFVTAHGRSVCGNESCFSFEIKILPSTLVFVLGVPRAFSDMKPKHIST
jgi:hypothetical protein